MGPTPHPKARKSGRNPKESRLALLAPGVQLVLQQPDRGEFDIAAKNEAHGFRLAIFDDELAVLCPIPQRRHPAHPHPFLLRGGPPISDRGPPAVVAIALIKDITRTR